jgi:hypothetical protein
MRGIGMKKLISALLAACLLLFLSCLEYINPVVLASGGTNVAVDKLNAALVMYIDSPLAYINNSEFQIDDLSSSIRPFVKDGEPYIPIRFAANYLGADVLWDQKSATASLLYSGNTIKIPLFADKVNINDKSYNLDDSIEYIDGRMFIELSDLADILSVKTYYDNNLIIISSSSEFDNSNDAVLLERALSLFNPNNVGNSSGNISNLGLASKEMGWIYYYNPLNSQTISKDKLDGSQSVRINNDISSEINVVNNWIYYSNTSDNNSIYKLKTTGTSRTKLNNDSSSYINVSNGWIYYSNSSDNNCIYKIRTDGSEKTKICNDSSLYISVLGDWIYYSNASDDYKLYKIGFDGSGKLKLNDDKSFFLNTTLDSIYYSNISDGGKIYSISLDGTENRKINEDRSYFINVTNSGIFYCNLDDSKNLYKIGLDGSNKTKLYEGKIEFINVVDNWVYFTAQDEEEIPALYRINIDGSGLLKVE